MPRRSQRPASPRKRSFVAESNADAKRRRAQEQLAARPAIAAAAHLALLAAVAAQELAEQLDVPAANPDDDNDDADDHEESDHSEANDNEADNDADDVDDNDADDNEAEDNADDVDDNDNKRNDDQTTPTTLQYWRRDVPSGWQLFDDYIPYHRRLVTGTRICTVPIRYTGFPKQIYIGRLSRDMVDYSRSVFVRYEGTDDDDNEYQIRRDQLYAWQ